jgi:hypothetical protein
LEQALVKATDGQFEFTWDGKDQEAHARMDTDARSQQHIEQQR